MLPEVSEWLLILGQISVKVVQKSEDPTVKSILAEALSCISFTGYVIASCLYGAQIAQKFRCIERYLRVTTRLVVALLLHDVHRKFHKLVEHVLF